VVLELVLMLAEMIAHAQCTVHLALHTETLINVWYDGRMKEGD